MQISLHWSRNLSIRKAAALPLTFLMAWEGLVDHADIIEGQKFFGNNDNLLMTTKYEPLPNIIQQNFEPK